MFYIFADGQLVYSTESQELNTILAPSCSLEIGKSGSLDFTMLPGHYLYGVIEKLKTRIIAFMDGEEIFRGRVLNWDIDFYKQKVVHCEGNLAYLLDTIQPPRRVQMTVAAFLTEIIAEHNLQVEVEKQFTLGSVVITGGSTVVEFSNESFRDTRSAIDTDLISIYGGFLRTRTIGTTTYLDYLHDYGSSASQKLEFGLNILDMNQSMTSAEIFTVLLPTGNSVETTPGLPPLPVTIESVNGGSKLLENAEAISKYGRVVHTETFSGLTDPAAIKAAGEAYIARVYKDPHLTFTIRALDLHMLDSEVQQFAIGNLIRVISSPHNINLELTCLAIEYDFENVENTEFTIGPIIDIPGGVSSGQSLSSAVGQAVGGASGSGGKVGRLYKYYTEGDDWAKIQAKKIDIIGETVTIQGETISLQAGDITSLGAQIVVEKDRITAEVARSTAAEGTLSGQITIEAGKITAEVERAKAGEATLQGLISVEAERISLEVSQRTNDVATLSGRIDVTATDITLEVTNRTNADNALSSSITIAEQNIALKVDKAGVITAINIAPGTVTIDAAKLNVSGIISAGGIAVDGDISATNAAFNNLISGNTTVAALKAAVIQSSGSVYAANMFSGPTLSLSGTGMAANFTAASMTLNGSDLAGLLAGKASASALASVIGVSIPNIWVELNGKLGTGGKAADSNLLDGKDWSEFSLSGHTHDSRYALIHSHPYAASNHAHPQSSKTVVTDVGLTVSYAYPAGIKCVATATLTKSTSSIYYYDP